MPLAGPQFTGQAVWRYNPARLPELDALRVSEGPTGVGLVPLSDDLMDMYVTTPEPGDPRCEREEVAATMRANLAGVPAPVIRDVGPRRPAHLRRNLVSRVTEIRYVGYGVADLAAERAFYADAWKLKEVADQDGLVYFAAEGSDEKYVARLREDPANRIDVIALAADTRDDVDALFARVEAAGCKTIFPPKALESLGGGYGFRFFSPDGLPFEVSADVERGPSREVVKWEAVPQKISHIVLHSPDHKAMVQFFIDVLGFKLSDWLGDFMAFLRCNEWHHRIAILPGPPCLNHVAYDMLSVDCMMRGVSRLRKNDIDIRWGPGRHTAGNNTFSYFVTPNGFAVEYTSEVESVDFETHEAKVRVPGPGTMDQWGVGVGGPQTMPHPKPDAGLFQPVAV